MKFLIVSAIVFVIYYLRRYWLTPWARFVSFTSTKRGDWFLTVKHVHWYPPFLDYEATYHLYNKGCWSDDKTGSVPWDSHQDQLTWITQAQLARERQVNEIMEDL